jgi:hypothetical protein
MFPTDTIGVGSCMPEPTSEATAMSTGHNFVNRHGTVTRYDPWLRMADVLPSADLEIGQRIHIVGASTDLEQTVDSLKLGNRDVTSADGAATVSIGVQSPVQAGDALHKEP